MMVDDDAVDQVDKQEEILDAEGTMITSLCWISRGFAKPVLEEANFADDEKVIK